MWHLLYNGLLVLASPVILAMLLAKQRCRRGLRYRLGLTAPAISVQQRPLIWVHAVSLGEVVAVAPLVKELQRRHAEYRFVVSTVTETGREAVEQRLAGVAEHCYAPLDFPWSVRRVTGWLQPALYLFVETELWPNLLRHLASQAVPTIMVNGRLSSRSYARQQWQPIRSFYRWMVQSLRLCLMQSDRDVERIISLGAPPQSVRRTGNIKFDQPPPDPTQAGPSRVSLGLAADAPLFVAGSTHPGEEEMVVEAFRQVLVTHPEAQLILAPRHIERAQSVESMVRDRGLAVRRRSLLLTAQEPQAGAIQVLLLDTRGELATLYREATVAFVGGTLVPVGGHNLLEPALWAKPVLFGPYTDHCAEIADLLFQAGGAKRVTTSDELAGQFRQWLERADERQQVGRAAQGVVRDNQGALQATVDAIEAVMASSQPNIPAARTAAPVPLMAGR